MTECQTEWIRMRRRFRHIGSNLFEYGTIVAISRVQVSNYYTGEMSFLLQYRRNGSCRQRNTKHTPTSHAKDTHTHTTAHTASLIYQLVEIHERHTQSKDGDRSTALARLEVDIYYWGLKPVYVHTASLLSPILTL